jgi:hypothetical protein
MNIMISQEALNKNYIGFNEYILLLLLSRDFRVSAALDWLLKEGYIQRKENNTTFLGYEPTSLGISTINTVIANSSPDDEKKKSNALAIELKNIFPKGKKDGTNQYWAEGQMLIVKRLALFFRKYGEQSSEDILDAARRYVASFNGNYTYMKTLKYFIFKEKIGVGREVEAESDLMTYIENKDEVDTSNFESGELI